MTPARERQSRPGASLETINLSELERLANGAEYSPWSASFYRSPRGARSHWGVGNDLGSEQVARTTDGETAHYIAAASPDVVLRLVMLIRKLAAEVDAANELVVRGESPLSGLGPPASDFMNRCGIIDAGAERPQSSDSASETKP